MTKSVADKLTDLVKAVRGLPDETQEVLLDEFAERVSDFADSTDLTDAQSSEVRRRLANPRYADPAAVRALFARHGVKTA
jgi:hypothetical protein